MKTFGYIVGTIATLFIILLIVATNIAPPNRKHTQYEDCKDMAEHQRSDRETEDVMRNMCDLLPVENADLR